MIKILPSNIANLIAAGEVVQRPSSVVKELMENAVDAGSSVVTVVINDSGRTLIQVIDNGCGMLKDEAILSFERHATSKISKAEDLYKINTFGFRGEALASIASCAEVTLKTRKEGEDCGCQITIAESKVTSCTDVSTPVGSNFAVRNLFYNIPARRKFLKSDNVEYRQIVLEFTKVALSKINIAFKLIHNSKEVFNLPPANNLKVRISQLFGTIATKGIIPIKTETNIVNIYGFVGTPESAKKNQPNQYLFVNGRYFKSTTLYKAIIKSYNQLIADGTYPPYYIFLEIDPSKIDVNIHPTKTEIKFEQDNNIFEILSACMREAIGGFSLSPTIDFNTEGAVEMPIIDREYRQSFNINNQPMVNFDPYYNPFNSYNMGSSNYKYGSGLVRSKIEEGGGVENDMIESGVDLDNYKESELFDPAQQEQNVILDNIIVVKNKYIITTVSSGILLIDIYRANQKIVYNRYMQALSSNSVGIEESLFPEVIDLDHNSFSIVMENRELLKRVGFDIRPFGKNCIVVSGVPSLINIAKEDIKESIDSIIASLNEYGENLEEQFKKRIAMELTKHISNKRDYTSPKEAKDILDALFATEQPEISPFGTTTMAIINIEDLVKYLN